MYGAGGYHLRKPDRQDPPVEFPSGNETACMVSPRRTCPFVSFYTNGRPQVLMGLTLGKCSQPKVMATLGIRLVPQQRGDVSRKEKVGRPSLPDPKRYG